MLYKCECLTNLNDDVIVCRRQPLKRSKGVAIYFISLYYKVSIFLSFLLFTMVSAAEATEIDNHFKQRLQQSQERWAARGKDARIAANNARLAKNPWREVTGLKFLVNEAKTPGTRPFAVGFA